jgi:hypothetical protein
MTLKEEILAALIALALCGAITMGTAGYGLYVVKVLREHVEFKDGFVRILFRRLLISFGFVIVMLLAATYVYRLMR